ncbi:MAG: DUF5947 family protein [Chloroflexia bacterium]
MNQEPGSQAQTPYSILKRFVRPRAATEVCDLCSEPIASEHPHLIELSSRQLLCACDACAILFSTQGETKYKRVPFRSRYLPNFKLTDAQWDELSIPVGMAFFFYNSKEGRMIAYYPSPAGPTESLLTLEAWDEVVRDNPILADMQSDVEALLVNRLGDEREYYLAPLDKCYELVGLIRLNWKGLSGGPEVWKEIKQFYSTLKDRSDIVVSKSATEANMIQERQEHHA